MTDTPLFMSRRFFLGAGASLALLGSPLFSTSAAAKAPKRNLVVIMLRGGMDGLTAVPARDPQMNKSRPDISVEGVRKLTSDFTLHPELEHFHNLWQRDKAAVVHATSIPYTGRSHFDGQNLMESGGHTPYAEKTGWLGRGLEAAGLEGLSATLPIPLLLRAGINPDNYFPTYWSPPRQDTMRMLLESYENEPLLKQTMAKIIQRPAAMLQEQGGGRKAPELAKTAARELAREDGPRVAVFDIGGFDTHAAQGGADGEHGEKLSMVDKVIERLDSGMGEAFDNTLVVTLTEFGRTLDQNGGYGTEHGYGTAILMAGGLVNRAQIHADWPGLKARDLFEKRDLNATIDARAVYASAMAACFDQDFEKMRRDVFWGEAMPDLTTTLFKV